MGENPPLLHIYMRIKKGIYKGELKSLSWKDGNIIDLKSPGRRLLEMNIIPYNGVVLSDKS